MLSLIHHRGPDETGSYQKAGASLGIQRLSILDLRTGQQPVTNEAGSVHLVFNGEIYNYRELRSDLIGRGHRFRSEGDSEVIVHLYEDLGEDAFTRLRGMFAIALWDVRRQKLVLVRDRLGKKPLYYATVGGELVFASEIKAILDWPELSREIDFAALADYLAYLYVPAPRTIFRSIRSLDPGHIGTFEGGRFELKRYWSVPHGDERPMWSEAEWIDRVRAKLAEAVKLRLVSDVPLGAFLSGGLDSSLIVAMMAEHGPVKTYSIGFSETASGYSELPHARRVAELLQTNHHEAVAEVDTLDLLPKLLWHFDQPFGNSTAPLAYLLSKFAREQVTVAMAGTGGDELFSGYPRHLGLRLAGAYDHLPRFLRPGIYQQLLDLIPESTAANTSVHRLAKRIRRFLGAAHLGPGERYVRWLTYFDRFERLQLLKPELREEVASAEPESLIARAWQGSGSDLERAFRVDMQTFLPFNQLEYMDKMSMACSLEARAPFCDSELVELCAGLPDELRIKGVSTKYLLKKVAEAYLPRDVIHRQKVGFDAPVGAWLKTSLRSFAESFYSSIGRFQLVDEKHVQVLFAEHLSGRRDLSLHLWMLLVLEVWYQIYEVEKVSSQPVAKLEEVLGLSLATGP